MKKTLITLAALAMGAVAQAADTEIPWGNLVLNLAPPTTRVEGAGQNYDFATSNGEYTMIFIMDRANVADNLGKWSDSANWTTIQIGAAGEGMYWKHALTWDRNDYDNTMLKLSADGTTVTKFDSITGAPFVGDSDTVDSADTDFLFANESDVVKGKVAFSLTTKKVENGLTFTLGVMEGDGSFSTASWTKTGWNVTQAFDSFTISDPTGAIEHMLVFNRALTVEEIEAVTAIVVPEPATATLSLLALAGLAARRRRK